jgi:hypothetical protein
LAQLQKQFALWIFNSNFVLNLNLHPKGKLFTMIQATDMQSLENFESREGSFWYFAYPSKFEIRKCLSSELGPPGFGPAGDEKREEKRLLELRQDRDWLERQKMKIRGEKFLGERQQMDRVSK